MRILLNKDFFIDIIKFSLHLSIENLNSSKK